MPGTRDWWWAIDPESEPSVSVLADQIIEGRYLRSGAEAIIGESLANNLGLGVGGEIVVIGSAFGGGIAAFVCEVVGIFDAGFPLLNRTLVQVPRALAAESFNIEGRAHEVVMRFDDPLASDRIVEEIRSKLEEVEDSPSLRVRDWKQVNSELYSGIRFDALSSVFIYSIIILMVGFTILGSVLMVMFERRAEFGVLMALGMRTSSLRALVHWEIFWLWLIGALVGLALVGAFCRMVWCSRHPLCRTMQTRPNCSRACTWTRTSTPPTRISRSHGFPWRSWHSRNWRCCSARDAWESVCPPRY